MIVTASFLQPVRFIEEGKDMTFLRGLLVVALITGFAFMIQPAAEAQNGTVSCERYAGQMSGLMVAYPGNSAGDNGPFESAVYSFSVTTGQGITGGSVRLVADPAGAQTLAGPFGLPATFSFFMPGDPGDQPPGMGIYIDSVAGGAVEQGFLQIAVTCGYAGCMPDIPPQAVVGAFTQTAEIYWAPGHLAAGEPPVETGKTYWVAGQDETGMYRKILIACEWVWVRAETVGPNFDEVWNGRPLPGTIVE
jgi:hypothetical protein